MRKQAAILANMNTYTEAERDAALIIANKVSNLAQGLSGYAPLDDREAAADALKAVVAQSLLGDAFVIVPRYVLAELRKNVGELPA